MFVYTFLSMLLSTLLIFLGLRFRRLYGVVCVFGNFRFLVLGRDGNGIDQGAVIFMALTRNSSGSTWSVRYMGISIGL